MVRNAKCVLLKNIDLIMNVLRNALMATLNLMGGVNNKSNHLFTFLDMVLLLAT